MYGEGVVEALHYPGDGGQLGCRLHLASGIVLREYPTVIGIAFFAVGHGGGISQEHILAEVVADNASIETSQGEIAVHHAERTVLHLLQQVVLAVGLMDFCHASVLVDGCHIEFGMLTPA